MMPQWIFWLGVVLVLGVIEMATTNLVTIWFVASGLLAILLSLFKIHFGICFAVFVLVGVALLLLTKPFLKKYMRPRRVATNLDRVIGTCGIVTQEISTLSPGEVKTDGKLWTAVSDEDISAGETVQILSIDGVKLFVRRTAPNLP